MPCADKEQNDKMSNNTDTDKLFFELIRVAIGNAVCLSHTPTAKEWQMLYEMAKKQSLIGICFAGVQRLQKQSQCPPEMLYLQWMGMAAKIHQRNGVLNAQCAELHKSLTCHNFRPLILKGQSFACYYGDRLNLLRQSGDIDIYLGSNRIDVINYVKSYQKEVDWDYKHIHFKCLKDTEVELHYRVSVSRNLIRNIRLKKWFDENLSLHSFYDDKLGFVRTDYVLSIIICLNHLLSHVMYEGVGLRQIMDLYFILKNSSNINYSSSKVYGNNVIYTVQKILSHLNLLEFSSGCMWILKECFKLDDKYMLCKPNENLGRFLLTEIMIAGNFGHYDNRLTRSANNTSIHLYYCWLKHSTRLIRFFPVEVFWIPIGGLFLSTWRRWLLKSI